LGLPFTEQGIKGAVFGSPKEKASGPDRYIGIFFTSCWDIIKHDLIRAIQQFYFLNQQCLHFLNQAFVVLIPKKEQSQRITNYRPISLTHGFARLVTKILANRLSPELDSPISINQATFY
jgi:hypothetical protein